MEALQRLHNRGSVPTGYEIDNSVKLEADNTEYFSRNPSTDTNRQTFTFSTWVKRTELGQNARFIDVRADGQNWTVFGFDTSDRIVVYAIDGGVDNGYHYTPRYRDTSAWYHIVWKSDITNATAANRWQIYVNGVEITAKDIDYGTPPTNFFTLMNTTLSTTVGYNSDGPNGSSQYMAETHLIDGIALAPTEFGEFDEDTGIWKPIEYTGSYGTNGFYLDFESSGSLGADSSGNGNNFTLNNITAADQATDTPTNNFCTLNPLVFQNVNGVYSFITEGATKARSTQFDVYYTYAPTFGVTSGKWYAEFEYEGSNVDNLVGILDIDAVVPYNSRLGKAGAWSVGLYQANGKLYVTSDSGTTETASWGASAADGDIISVAVDMDNYFVYFAKNGTWQNSGVPTSGATGTGGVAFDSNKTVGIGCSTYGYTADGIIFTNLGGYTAGTISSAATDANGYGSFEYAPPSGYYALCTKNLEAFG